MLSFKFVTNAGGAAHYFESTDDYYSKEGHRGTWQGEGAARLGLAGGVERDVFKNLLEGKLPDGTIARTKMPKKQKDGKVSEERLGIDFTFSAPKSVSIVALINGDERLVKAHDDAVSAALKLLEAKALARKKQRGISFRQHTANLTFATFRHELSRTQDPQLHTHSVAMNLTQRDDGKWVALTNDEMLKSIKVVGAYYRAELAKRLQDLGYDIRQTRHGFELASISDKAIKLFSTRSQQVEEALRSKGLDRDSANSKTKQTITKATRPTKTETDREVLRQEWLQTLKEANITLTPKSRLDTAIETVIDTVGEIGRSFIPAALAEKIEANRAQKESEKARIAVDLSIEHLMERQGIFSKAELLERAYQNALGSHSAIETEITRAISDGRILAELPLYQSAKSFSRDAKAQSEDFQYDKFKHDGATKLTETSWVALTMANTGKTQEQAAKIVKDSIEQGRLVRAEERYTTRSMLADELTVLSMAKAGRNALPPVTTAEAVKAMFAGTSLNQGQLSAAALILTSPDRFVGIQGYAGVGKSHMLKEAVDAIKAETIRGLQHNGYEVIGLAPYASQNKALAELGMKSQTLASFLMRKQDHGKLTDKSIVFLDEASVVPVHQMRDLMEKIERAGARGVLIGDVKQTQAVEAGKPFEQLVDSGMAVAHITDIRRQENPELRAAVVDAAQGNITSAAHKLNSRTTEIKNPEGRYKAIAAEYLALPAAARHETLIVAGTNKSRREINSLVREGLNLAAGKTVKTLISVDMTRAEKKQASSFAEDQIVIFEAGKRGSPIKRGVQYEIDSISPSKNQIVLRDPERKLHTINPAEFPKFSAYEREDIELAVGDWVRMTRNNSKLRIANGERYQVEKITPDTLHFSNGVSLPRGERLHLQYGYAMTVHSAQGLTKDRVIIDVDTKSLTSNRAVFYVAISRPRRELSMYTDDRTALPQTVAREPKKYAALELRRAELESAMLQRELSRNELARAMRSAAPAAGQSMNLKKQKAKTHKM
jgi:conjugative relaxase-like TrwC/TraI family protein